MVDTVWAVTDSFKVRDRNSLLTQSTANSDGEVLKEKRYVNLSNNRLLVDVIQNPKGGELLRVKSSLPKLTLSSSIFELSDCDAETVYDAIASRLDTAGIECGDVGSMTLQRLDYCRNLRGMSRRPGDYINALSTFGMSRRGKKSWAEETVLFSNSQRQFIGYDKCAEVLASLKKEKDPLVSRVVRRAVNASGNVLRLESRLLKTRTVREMFWKKYGNGQPTLRDTFKREVSIAHLQSELDGLIGTGDELVVVKTNLSFLEKLRQEVGTDRGLVNKFLMVKGADSLLKDFGYDWQRLRRFCLEAFPDSRRSVYRTLAQLKKWHRIETLSTVHSRDLIKEIRERLAA